MPEASTTSALMLEYQQVESEENFSTRSFDTLENVGMTSADRRKFSSTVFNTQSNEISVKKLSLQRRASLTSADQQDRAAVSEISEHLTVTREPEAQILRYDLEIPPQAAVVSVPLSFLPPKMQQLIPTRTEDVSEVREATEIPTVTYIWPVLKTEEACKPFWDNFSTSLTSPDLARQCSSPDVVMEDVKRSQITPVKQLEQGELESKTRKSYSLILKSSNSVISGILRSLTDTKNQDYKNIILLSSINPIGEKMKIPAFKENAIMIHNGQVYLLYVTRHRALSPEMEIHSQDKLLEKTTICFITCRDIRNITTKDSHPLQSSQCTVKQNIKSLKNLAAHQDETSKATHSSSHRMTTMSQPKQCSPLNGKEQQVLPRKAAFPSKEEFQKRNKEEAQQQEDNELKKKFGILKDVRIHLKRLPL